MKQRTRIWKKNICRTTTDALPIRRRVRLSRPEADGPRTAGDFPLRDRAHDQQGLGDPPQGSFSATAAWAAALWTYAKQGPGLRNGRTERCKVYYRGERVAYTELKEPIRKTTRPMPAPVRPIVVRKAKPDHPWRQAYQSMKLLVPNPGIANASGWNTHFRFALATGLRCSAHSNQNTTTQKGDISNKLTMGHFY